MSAPIEQAPLSESEGDQQPLRSERAILFFDGTCGLCNHTVDFILKRLHADRFRFAPLQGETAEQRLPADDVAELKSLVLIDEAGTHRRSAAVVRILHRLGGGWALLGGLLWLIPAPIRDVGYRLVARYRYRIFGQKETCRLPSEQERAMMLP